MISKVFVYLLVGLLILGFAVFGVADVFLGGKPNSVANINGVEIDVSEVDAITDNYIKSLSDPDISNAERNQHRQNILLSLVNKEILVQKANDVGLIVSNKQISDAIKQTEYFLGEDGKFDINKFNELLAYNRISEKKYIADRNRDISASILQNSLTYPDAVPNNILNILAKIEGQSAVIDRLTIPFSAVKIDKKATAEELQKYYNNNNDKFIQEELRSAKFVTISAADIEDQMDLSEEALKASYEENKHKYLVPEKRSLYQILADDEGTAQNIYKELNKGRSFREIAEEVAEQSKESTNIGSYSQLELLEQDIFPAELVEFIFASDIGSYSQPYETSFGWVVVAIGESTESYFKDFDDVRELVKNEYIQDSQELIYNLSIQFEDAIAGGADFDATAAKLNLLVENADNFNSQAIGEDGRIIKHPAYGDFIAESFNLSEGEVSRVIGSDEGNEYYVVKLTKISPERIKSFDEVRGLVSEMYQEQVILDELKLIAENAVKEISSGDKTIADVAKQLNIKVKSNETILTNTDSIAENLRDEIFSSLKIGQVSSIQPANKGGYDIAILKEFKYPDINDKGSRMLAEYRYTQQLAADNLVLILDALRKDGDIYEDYSQFK